MMRPTWDYKDRVINPQTQPINSTTVKAGACTPHSLLTCTGVCGARHWPHALPRSMKCVSCNTVVKYASRLHVVRCALARQSLPCCTPPGCHDLYRCAQWKLHTLRLHPGKMIDPTVLHMNPRPQFQTLTRLWSWDCIDTFRRSSFPPPSLL